ncbi:MAG TPA: formyltransferase family protein [Vicinamibacterales bacterium]|nr:formyltransferase family protein [Vicinamibacterales bacterium]
MLTLARHPLRVAVLCSRRAPGLLHLLERDPGRGEHFDIACVMTSEETCPDAIAGARHAPPVLTHPIRELYGGRPPTPVHRDAVTRRAYDWTTLDLIAPFAPDIVLLDGYLYLVTRPLLEAYPNRILNLHFSDLTIRGVDRRPTYPGIRAVRAALADGQNETSATVHLVNDQPDEGAPIVRSWSFPVSPLVSSARQWGAADMLKAYGYAHQEWMIRGASGPLLSAALHLVASGVVDLDLYAGWDPAGVKPWLVDEKGRLTPPAATRLHAILDGYKQGHPRSGRGTLKAV